jgi:excisionase family DNA binding protein
MPEVHTASPRAKLLDVEGVMAQLSVGRSTVFQLMGSNRLRSVKVGRRRLVPQVAVDELVASLLATSESEAESTHEAFNAQAGQPVRIGDVPASGGDAA